MAEPAGCCVVPDRRAGAREAEPASRALATAFDRPRGRRAAARAQRRLDPLELVAAAGAELSPPAAAHDAALRQEQVEHPPTLGRDVSRERVGSVEAVRRARGQTGEPSQPVVRLEQLRPIPDVVPGALEAIAVDRLALREPAQEAAGIVRAHALAEVRLDEPDVLGRY